MQGRDRRRADSIIEPGNRASVILQSSPSSTLPVFFWNDQRLDIDSKVVKSQIPSLLRAIFSSSKFPPPLPPRTIYNYILSFLSFFSFVICIRKHVIHFENVDRYLANLSIVFVFNRCDWWSWLYFFLVVWTTIFFFFSFRLSRAIMYM